MSDADELTPEHKLLCAIIESAVKDKDIDYIMGEGLEYHCELLNLDPEEIRLRFLKRGV